MTRKIASVNYLFTKFRGSSETFRAASLRADRDRTDTLPQVVRMAGESLHEDVVKAEAMLTEEQARTVFAVKGHFAFECE
jgi:hypothetical protein